MIDQKYIKDKVEIYYLHRYLSGYTKKEIDVYFLRGIESAYVAAFEILDERSKNQFTIAKACRKKF